MYIFYRNQLLYTCFYICITFHVILHQVETIEPISTTIIVGGVAVSSYYYLKCLIRECCDDTWIRLNIAGLKSDLYQKLHGQHLVTNSVVKLIRGHFSNAHPNKALVLSFHGCSGCGKNYVSHIIANNTYVEGMKSQFVHQFVATLHFPHAHQAELYKDQIRHWVRGNVSLCARSLFIFDEMDKMPASVIDAIKPFIDNFEEIDGIDFRKAFFIFRSNTGAQAINKNTFNWWMAARNREEIQLEVMEEVIRLEAYNVEGGLWHSRLVEKNLVSAFIPFLPMERTHVKLCISDELRRKGRPVTAEIVNKIADKLEYNEVFSKSGCHRVSDKVDMVLED